MSSLIIASSAASPPLLVSASSMINLNSSASSQSNSISGTTNSSLQSPPGLTSTSSPSNNSTPNSATQHGVQLNPSHQMPFNSATMMPYHPNFKDTRWLTLEVCREFQRNKCNRTENECKFAHPQPHVEVLNGKVIACYDSLKGKCSRREPPCKYLHPPQHLKDQLLQNGKNNLVLKQVALAMMHQQHHQQQVPQQAAQHHQNAMLAAASPTQFHTSYHGAPGASALYNQMANGSIQPLIQVTSANGQQTLVPLMTNGFHPSGLSLQSHANAIYATDPTTLIQHVQAPNLASQNTILPHQRTDRLTVCREHQKGTCSKSANECSQAHPPAYCPVDADSQLVTVCVDFIKGKCSRDTCKYFHPPEHLVAQLKKQKNVE